MLPVCWCRLTVLSFLYLMMFAKGVICWPWSCRCYTWWCSPRVWFVYTCRSDIRILIFKQLNLSLHLSLSLSPTIFILPLELVFKLYRQESWKCILSFNNYISTFNVLICVSEVKFIKITLLWIFHSQNRV